MAVQVPLEHQGIDGDDPLGIQLIFSLCSHDYSIYPSSDSTNLRPHSTVYLVLKKIPT